MRKDEIENKIAERQIVLDESVTWTNEKLIKALGDWTIKNSVKNAFCWGARYLQSLETVQLCRHLKDEMKSFEKAGINPMISDDYVAEYKENGSRVFVYYDPAVGFKFFSRRESKSTFLNNDFTSKVLLITKDGLITNPPDYKGKYNYRFILDGEVTVSGSSIFEGVDYGSNVDDLMQAIMSSLPDRAKSFQLAGSQFVFSIFDCIYFEKAPTGVPSEVHFDYKVSDTDLDESQISWVEAYFKDYLRTAGFQKYSSAKKLYRYLYSLKNTLQHDIRKYPFIKRRQIRHGLVDFLVSKGLPFKEIEGEDKNKVEYLDEVLSACKEGIILKNIHAPYISALRSSRTHRAAMKVKQSINAMLKEDGESIDFDVFIVGINPPKSDRITDMIGALNCAIYINDNGNTYEHVIASVSGIPHEWKRELCSFDKDGKMILNPEYYGKVIAINGLALTAKLKFQHAVLASPNGIVLKDKDATECTWDKTALEQLVITRGY